MKSSKPAGCIWSFFGFKAFTFVKCTSKVDAFGFWMALSLTMASNLMFQWQIHQGYTANGRFPKKGNWVFISQDLLRQKTVYAIYMFSQSRHDHHAMNTYHMIYTLFRVHNNSCKLILYSSFVDSSFFRIINPADPADPSFLKLVDPPPIRFRPIPCGKSVNLSY